MKRDETHHGRVWRFGRVSHIMDAGGGMVVNRMAVRRRKLCFRTVWSS